MQPGFITYQKFDDVGLANELAELLEESGIEYYIEEQTSGFDPSLVMSNAVTDYAVKINAEDFEQVNQLLKEIEEKNIDGIDKDYYLFSFSDDEMIDVITKADEWSTFDNLLAQKILTERGKGISAENISAMHNRRIEELKKPEPSQTAWIEIGYVFALLGGVFGIFIGWHLSTYKKTLPTGERVYGYNENDRKNGNYIFFIGIIVTVIVIVYRIAREI